MQRKEKHSHDDGDGGGGGGGHDDQECSRERIPASQPYQTLSPGGGVAEGEVLQNSPGCSGMSESGPCRPGGVDEVLRASVDEPLRDTQEVSMTRTPMLWWLGGKGGGIKISMSGNHRQSGDGGMESGRWLERTLERGVPLNLPNAALVGTREAKGT